MLDTNTFVGDLRPAGTPVGLPLSESSFLITVPMNGFPDPVKRQHIVLLLSTTQTSSAARPEDREFGPHDYPGDPTNFGLWPSPFPGTGLVEEFAAMSASQAPFYVVAAHIVPRTSHQPLVATAQRLRELWRATQLVVMAHYFPVPHVAPNWTRCVSGTSFGGLTTQVALQLWPDEFHSGVSFAFNGSLRSLPEDQRYFDFLVGGVGFAGSGAGYTLRSAVDWTIFTRLEDVDYQSLSMVNRAHRPLMNERPRRPMVLLVGDEDPVTHGQDWIQTFAGSTGLAQPYSVRRSFTDAFGTVDVDVLVIGKSCHGGEIGELSEPFRFPGETTFINDIGEPVRRMVFAAHQQWVQGRVLPPLTPSERKLPKAPTLTTADPYDHVFDRGFARSAQAGSAQSMLVEATSAQGWNRFGSGTSLGIGESLKVVKLPGDTYASIFAGSADGVVTRHRLDPVLQPPLQPLVEAARTSSLGYAVFALDVGDLDPGRPGLEVVVGAYRRIAVLDAASLAVLAIKDLDEFDHTEPQRIQIAEIYSGNSTREIVFRTLHGRIVVMGIGSGGALAVLGEHAEGGVHEVLVGPAIGGNTTPYTNGLWVLSARGHLAGLSLHPFDPQAKQIGMLERASPLLYGALTDLDVVNGQLAVLSVREPEAERSIRIYNPANLQLVAQFGKVHHPTFFDEAGDEQRTKLSLPVSDPNLAVTAQGRYVVLYGDHLLVFDYQGDAAAGIKRLGSFGPAVGACGMAVGDVDGDGDDDVVVSTFSGRIVWFTIDELTTTGFQLGVPRAAAVVGGQLIDHRANSAIAATWGFARGPGTTTDRLHAIDPSGGWWVLDPLTGLPVLTAGRPGLVLETNLQGIRGMAFGGVGSSSLAIGFGGTNDTHWNVLNGSILAPPGATIPIRMLATTPYLPPPPSPSPLGWSHQNALSTFSWDDFWLFRKGGSAVQHGGGWRAAMWGDFYTNLVQQFGYTLQAPTPPHSVGLHLWSSTGTGTGQPPPTPAGHGLPASQGGGRTLRSSVRQGDVQDLQAVVYARFGVNAEPEPVVAGTGGRVILLNGTTGEIRAQSEDLGFGGMALAAADLDGDGIDEILFAAATSPIDAHGPNATAPPNASGNPARSWLHVLRYDAGFLVRHSSVPIGDPFLSGHDLPGFAACGIAVADLNETGQPNPTPEVLVTTLNGEFVVFGQAGGATLNPTPLYRAVLDGQLGAFNSIVVRDLDNTNLSKPEVYIASSIGVRKFYAQ